MKRIPYIFLVILVTVMVSCSKYTKLLKGGDINAKLEAAEKYYKKKDFAHALGLYEQLTGYYNGQPEQEKIQYYLAYCNYNLGSLDLASYMFKSYYETYPNSKYAEECFYLYAYSHYLNSQGPELDQSSTYKAIEELQAFINIYPESKERIAEANTLIDKLRAVLVKKSYLQAKLYFNIGDYKAAITCIKITIKDFPDVEQREELEFLTSRANFLLAKISIEEYENNGVIEHVKLNRFQNAIEAAYIYKDSYPTGKYIKDVDVIIANAKEEIKNLQPEFLVQKNK